MNKTDIIKLRVTPAEKAAFAAIAKGRGTTVSGLFRAYLARVVAKATRRDNSA